MKTAVYSWRLSIERKAELEGVARREGISLSALLDRMTADWLAEHRNGHADDEAEQAAIRKRVMATVGTIRSGDSRLATRAREIVRDRILRKHAQEAHAPRRTH